MEDGESVIVERMASLLAHMNSKEFHVEWQVLSDIGPEWIGSRREICFMLDGVPLQETRFHDELKDSLINLANIPATSSDHVISGEGTVTRVDGVLEVSYSWRAAIPYQHFNGAGEGRGILWTPE